MKQSLLRYLPLLLLAIAWEIVARFELVSTSALPPLTEVISAGVAMVKDGELSAMARPRSTAPVPDWRSQS